MEQTFTKCHVTARSHDVIWYKKSESLATLMSVTLQAWCMVIWHSKLGTARFSPNQLLANLFSPLPIMG